MSGYFETLTKDTPDPVECQIKGTVPRWLTGSLIRNGSGVFDFGGVRVNHWFDGMAVLHRFTFREGSVSYRNRLLDSEAQRRCAAANRLVVSGFATLAFPDPCKSIFTRYFSHYLSLDTQTDNTNVNVLELDDQLYAMTETAAVNRVDPETLKVMDKLDMEKLLSIHHHTAHPLKDADGTTYNLGTTFSKPSIYRIIRTKPGTGSDEKSVLSSGEVLASVPAQWSLTPSYSHSFGASENFLILVEQPLGVSLLSLATAKLRNVSFRKALKFYKDEKARFHLIEKKTGKVHPITYTSDAFFFFHSVNAFEEDGCVVLDLVTYEDDDVIEGLSLDHLIKEDALPEARLSRFVFPLTVKEGVSEGESLPVVGDCTASAVASANSQVFCTPQTYGIGPELPRINEAYSGQKYNFLYGIEGTCFNNLQLVKYDLEAESRSLWRSDDPDLSPGEPVFVPRPSPRFEDDGVILSPVVSASPLKPSFLLVLDAQTFNVLGRAEVPQGVHMPLSYHGLFTQL